MQNLPTLTLKSGRDRSVNNKHPWVFSGAVKNMPKAEDGDIIKVQDNQKQVLAYGFYSTKSQITCRIFEFTNQHFELEDFSATYWVHKIKMAHNIRKDYVIAGETNAYRLIHAEGDFLPGVIIDIYDQLAVVQLLVKGTEKIIPYILEALKTLGYHYAYLKVKENALFLQALNLETNWLSTPYEKEVSIKENGLKFPVDFEKGQKTGFFLDQRENRKLLQQYVKGKKVLNAFSYTGGFSVYALAGGAQHVDSVDISKNAIEACEQIVGLNFKGGVSHQAISADCFHYLRETEEKYDVIVLDPPAFAKNARSVPAASRGYKDLNLTAIQKINPGGVIFTFSCSGNISRDLFRKIVFAAAADANRKVRILHQLTQPVDHPINIYHPEGEYLKGLVLYVE